LENVTAISQWGLKRARPIFSSLLAGALLPGSFAPFYFSFLAFISPALLFLVWQNASPKAAFIRGIIFGLGFFSVGVSWVFISIHVYGQAPIPLAAFITAFFICYLSLFFGLQGYCLNHLFPKNTLSKLLLAYPCTWVAFEALRGWLFTGFPWLFIGYSQTNTWLKGYAPLFGVYGLSFIVVLLSAFLIIIFEKNRGFKKRLFPISSIFAVFFIGFLLSQIQWTHAVGRPQNVALIQGNIEQELKWQPEEIRRTLNLYYDYTIKNISNNIIIWPESAVTLPLDQADIFLQTIGKLAVKNKASIITGIPIINPEAVFNGMISLGNGSGIYYKRHLVPFGEYIPLKSFWNYFMKAFNIPMSRCEPGAKYQKPLLANGVSIAPYICYEIAYPLEVLAFLPQGQLLLTLTDDSWFGHSLAAKQHLQMAQMRAIETSRYLLFSSNTGITAAIDSKGNIINTIPPFEEGVLTARVQPMAGKTPWMIWKTAPLFVLMAILVLLRFTKRIKVKAFNFTYSRS
jgi:apolipoprotein N-acyltransferase